MMPMVGDILKFEYFLTPGTIITDGRTANAQFLNENFKEIGYISMTKNLIKIYFILMLNVWESGINFN